LVENDPKGKRLALDKISAQLKITQSSMQASDGIAGRHGFEAFQLADF
jgi:hypothetical protein